MVLSLDAADTIPGTPCPLQRQMSLGAYTSYRVGGMAEWFASPRTAADMQASLRWAQGVGLPVTLIGAGSNLLVSDLGLPGLVLCSRYLREVSFDSALGRLTAAAGEPLPNLAWKAARRGWRGLEWAVGIPGTVGGAVFMNAGASGGETGNILLSAQGLSPTGQPMLWLPEDLQFAYRSSILQQDIGFITEATFQLEPGHDPAQVMADTQRILEYRRRTQPYHLPSCGSVFRNPAPHSAGWLIEQTGLKGYQVGQAQVSERHANFIVNCGGARALDILRLIRTVQQRVEQQWDIPLHPEVRMLGEFVL